MTKGGSTKTTLNVSEIKNNPNNPRLIKDDKFKKLVESIKEFPEMLDAREIVVNKDHIILGGNMRFKAAVEAGIKEVPVKIVDWDEDKQKQFVIKDNVSGGEWDWDVLANEWDAEDLDKWGLDTPDNWGEETEIEEDEAPEVSSDPPKSKLGEVYQLGRHRVMCGDSTQSDQVISLMREEEADMVWIDPPYNVDYEGGTGLKIENDKMEDDKFYKFLLDAFSRCEENMKQGAPIYIAHADSEGRNFRQAMIDSGLLLKQCIIWVKNSMVLGRQDYQWQHEPILYGWKEGAAHKWYGDFDKKTIIDDTKDLKELKKGELLEIVKQLYQKTTAIKEDRPAKSGEHPTMKPIGLVARFIWNSSQTKDIVLDTFLGSGSTLIACEQTDRTCYGMELDPKYVDVIRKRYHKFINGSEEGWEDGTPAI